MNSYRVFVEEVSRVKFYEICEELDFEVEIDIITLPVYQEGRHYIISPRTSEAELSFVLKFPAVEPVK